MSDADLELRVAELEKENYRLRSHRSSLDCCFTNGPFADSGGSHCGEPPCQRCFLERLILELQKVVHAATIYRSEVETTFGPAGKSNEDLWKDLCDALDKWHNS